MFAKSWLFVMLAIRLDELSRELRFLGLHGLMQLVVFNSLRNAPVSPIFMNLKPCTAFIGSGHFLDELFPACMGMREATSCLAIPLHVLALLAV